MYGFVSAVSPRTRTRIKKIIYVSKPYLRIWFFQMSLYSEISYLRHQSPSVGKSPNYISTWLTLSRFAINACIIILLLLLLLLSQVPVTIATNSTPAPRRMQLRANSTFRIQIQLNLFSAVSKDGVGSWTVQVDWYGMWSTPLATIQKFQNQPYCLPTTTTSGMFSSEVTLYSDSRLF